ncbi:MAG: RluA family pseudouridine synthase [Calditrichia bacterium]
MIGKKTALTPMSLDGKKFELTVTSHEGGERLDKFLHHHFPEYSRTFLKKLILAEKVFINDQPEKPAYEVSPGDIVILHIPPPEKTDLVAEDIPLDIVFEDDQLLVINKPAGLVVHPGAGVRRGTLVNALLNHCQELSGVGGRLRPGIVHRLDKNTSGLLVVAKTDKAHLHLSHQFARKTATREYLALVWGHLPKEKDVIETFVNRSKRDRKLFTVSQSGKKAVTQYEVVREYTFLTQLKIRLGTGRTHQIRLHFQHLQHPVFGDPEYQGRERQLKQLHREQDRLLAKKLLKLMNRQALHAHLLRFIHPVTEQEMEFTAPLPSDFQAVVEQLEHFEKENMESN